MLNKPIFIKDSFVKPIFNEVMAVELKKAINQLEKQLTDKNLYSDIANIADELIKINNNLLNEQKFIDLVDKYNCHNDYKNINNCIMTSSFCYVCEQSYISIQTKYQIYEIMQKVKKLAFSENGMNWYLYQFIYRFLHDIYK